MRSEHTLTIIAVLILATVPLISQPTITGLQVACETVVCGDGICVESCESTCKADCPNVTSSPPILEEPQSKIPNWVPSWESLRPLLDNQPVILYGAAILLFLGISTVLLLRMHRISPIRQPRAPIYSLILSPPGQQTKPADIVKAKQERETMVTRHSEKLVKREEMFTPFDHRPPPPESALMRELRGVPSFQNEEQRRKAIQDLSRLATPSFKGQRKQ